MGPDSKEDGFQISLPLGVLYPLCFHYYHNCISFHSVATALFSPGLFHWDKHIVDNFIYLFIVTSYKIIINMYESKYIWCIDLYLYRRMIWVREKSELFRFICSFASYIKSRGVWCVEAAVTCGYAWSCLYYVTKSAVCSYSLNSESFTPLAI